MRIRKCVKLKERFASFVFALLIFSASWLPFSISTACADETDAVLELAVKRSIAQDFTFNMGVPIPTTVRTYMLDSAVSGIVDTGMNISPYFTTNTFKPTSYGRTLVFAFSPNIIEGYGYVDAGWLSDSSTGTVQYKLQDSSPNEWQETTYTLNGVVRSSYDVNFHPYMFYVSVPANAILMRFDTSENIAWQVASYNGTVTYNFALLGAWVLETDDNSIVNLVQRILSQTEQINTNANNIYTSVVNITNQLIALNADTDTIITMLSGLEDLSNKQLAELERISFNVDAIYALLADSLVDEADQFDEGTQKLADDIQQSANSEARWQANMQGSYEELNISNTNFGNLNGSIVFVMQLFEDMFDTFGAWSILFTFPLTIGIALLVIGRISKFGGGNSSRNTEHKGGEGGA